MACVVDVWESCSFVYDVADYTAPQVTNLKDEVILRGKGGCSNHVE